MNLFTLPPHVPFLDAIATEWLQASPNPLDAARGNILLPTRRAARSLAESFLRVSDGRALLLPRILALGGLDEAPLALTGALDLPPAVDPARRIAELTRLVLAMQGANGAPTAADAAWKLAAELARLMDEAERAEVDLHDRLPDATAGEFAEHWNTTLTFLEIVTRLWPQWLAEQGLMNPASRQVALLDAQAASWRDTPPPGRILAAGSTGGIPAVARLLRIVAGLPNGAVLLPALDLEMADTVWAALDDSHPQSGLKHLLEGMGAARGDVAAWPSAPFRDVPADRAAALARALLPAVALTEWQAGALPSLSGVFRLTSADPQHEATAIAIILRDALEVPDATSALVTPDRELAGRVAAELSRFGIVADDSAGEPLADTPPAVLLRLLAGALADRLAPVALLALLKHPLTAAGLSPADCRAKARVLERSVLRGPRPLHGLTGLRLALDRLAEAPGGRAFPETLRLQAIAFLTRLETCVAPALRLLASVAENPATQLGALIEAAERIAATDATSGPARLWAGEEGEALAGVLANALEVLAILPDQAPQTLPGLLDAVLAGVAVRSRRALRGRDGAEHPRVFIWGLLEARLQTADTIVLGGLTEGVWPRATEPGPWMSRQMRARVGLASPEEAVGQDAHDFFAIACAGVHVVLSCPRRRDGAPAVPARWISRLDAMLAGHKAGAQKLSLPEHPAAAWAAALDLPADGPKPVLAPTPRPPLALRPRKLSVTEIETWLRDPYAIHARHILKLRKLDPIDQETDAADYGTLVHAGIHRFLARHGTKFPANAARHLRDAFAEVMKAAGLRPALEAWWTPRLDRIADWIFDIERERRSEAIPEAILSELDGRWELADRRFTLTGRADRIERHADGSLVILDYKTGTVPSAKLVEAGLAPQLTLEAAMAQAGGFGLAAAGAARELAYWHLTGGPIPGERVKLFAGKASLPLADAVAEATDRLRARIDAFDDLDCAYLSHPHPSLAPRFSDYAQLARVAEWAAGGDEVGDDE